MNKMFRLIRTHKFINVFCYLFCVIYLIFAIAYIYVDYNKELYYNNQMNKYINSALTINKKLENEKFFKIDKPNKGPQNAETLFKDGETAILQAFEKIYNSKSFVISLNGEMTIAKTVLNADYMFNLTVKDTIIRYNKDLSYDDLSICYVSGTYPKVFEELVKKNVCYGSKSLRKGSEIYSYSVQQATMVDGEPVTNYENVGKVKDPKKCLIADNLPIVNRSTIKKIKFYKINYKDGKPLYYYISAELDGKEANKNLKKAFDISFPGFRYTPPNYKATTITACLDAYGNLMYFGTIDDADEYVETPVGKLNAPCKFYFNYVVGGINKEITFKPEGFDDELNLQKEL